jgi:1,5-anhydro-D-fructose reductase (1,5-anhydro-D-mannitol-forming)
MSHPLKIAAIGFWHVHAGDYANSVQEHPDTTLVAVWDDDEQRGREAAAQYGVEFAPDLDELLARPDLDGVTITTSTDQHHDVMLKAARAGKHIFTEKVLAPTVEEAEDIVAAASAAGVALVVSLPRLYDDYTQAIERILDDGSLGDLTYTRVRLTTAGWPAGCRNASATRPRPSAVRSPTSAATPPTSRGCSTAPSPSRSALRTAASQAGRSKTTRS